MPLPLPPAPHRLWVHAEEVLHGTAIVGRVHGAVGPTRAEHGLPQLLGRRSPRITERVVPGAGARTPRPWTPGMYQLMELLELSSLLKWTTVSACLLRTSSVTVKLHRLHEPTETCMEPKKATGFWENSCSHFFARQRPVFVSSGCGPSNQGGFLGHQTHHVGILCGSNTFKGVRMLYQAL